MPSLLPKLPARGAKADEFPGPPANGYTFLPWLLMGTGAVIDVAKGKVAHPELGALGILAFAVLYALVAFRAFDKRRRQERTTLVLLGALAAVTYALGLGYGGVWLLFFPLLSLTCGAVLRDKRLGVVIIVLAGSVGVISGIKTGDPWDNMTIAYGTFLSGMVIAALLSLSETIRELRDTRQELARTAVEKERLRFSRDLHDLLGHTLSVIVVKSEAARRIAPRDLDAALGQVADIESVGRQALTEIREAVTGYREGSLATELDRARSALSAAEVEPLVRQSGPRCPRRPRRCSAGWSARPSPTSYATVRRRAARS